MTQRFLAWSTAAASRAQRERGGQVGRDPLGESRQRTVGSGAGMSGLEVPIKSGVWGLMGGRSGGSQARVAGCHALPGPGTFLLADAPPCLGKCWGPSRHWCPAPTPPGPWPVLPPPTGMLTCVQLLCSVKPRKHLPARGHQPPERLPSANCCSAWGTVPWAAHEPVPAQPRSRGSRRAATRPRCSHTGSARLLACHSPASLCFFPSRNCFDLHSRGSLLKINVSWMLLPMA